MHIDAIIHSGGKYIPARTAQRRAETGPDSNLHKGLRSTQPSSKRSRIASGYAGEDDEDYADNLATNSLLSGYRRSAGSTPRKSGFSRSEDTSVAVQLGAWLSARIVRGFLFSHRVVRYAAYAAVWTGLGACLLTVLLAITVSTDCDCRLSTDSASRSWGFFGFFKSLMGYLWTHHPTLSYLAQFAPQSHVFFYGILLSAVLSFFVQMRLVLHYNRRGRLSWRLLLRWLFAHAGSSSALLDARSKRAAQLSVEAALGTQEDPTRMGAKPIPHDIDGSSIDPDDVQRAARIRALMDLMPQGGDLQPKSSLQQTGLLSSQSKLSKIRGLVNTDQSSDAEDGPASHSAATVMSDSTSTRVSERDSSVLYRALAYSQHLLAQMTKFLEELDQEFEIEGALTMARKDHAGLRFDEGTPSQLVSAKATAKRQRACSLKHKRIALGLWVFGALVQLVSLAVLAFTTYTHNPTLYSAALVNDSLHVYSSPSGLNVLAEATGAFNSLHQQTPYVREMKLTKPLSVDVVWERDSIQFIDDVRAHHQTPHPIDTRVLGSAPFRPLRTIWLSAIAGESGMDVHAIVAQAYAFTTLLLTLISLMILASDHTQRERVLTAQRGAHTEKVACIQRKILGGNAKNATSIPMYVDSGKSVAAAAVGGGDQIVQTVASALALETHGLDMELESNLARTSQVGTVPNALLVASVMLVLSGVLWGSSYDSLLAEIDSLHVILSHLASRHLGIHTSTDFQSVVSAARATRTAEASILPERVELSLLQDLILLADHAATELHPLAKWVILAQFLFIISNALCLIFLANTIFPTNDPALSQASTEALKSYAELSDGEPEEESDDQSSADQNKKRGKKNQEQQAPEDELLVFMGFVQPRAQVGGGTSISKRTMYRDTVQSDDNDDDEEEEDGPVANKSIAEDVRGSHRTHKDKQRKDYRARSNNHLEDLYEISVFADMEREILSPSGESRTFSPKVSATASVLRDTTTQTPPSNIEDRSGGPNTTNTPVQDRSPSLSAVVVGSPLRTNTGDATHDPAKPSSVAGALSSSAHSQSSTQSGFVPPHMRPRLHSGQERFFFEDDEDD